MTRRQRWVTGAACVASALPLLVAWAQPLVTQNLTGNEVVQAAVGPGGQGFLTPIYVLRGGTNYTLQPAGTTVNLTVPAATAKVVVTGAVTTLNLTLPTAPYDGQTVALACPGGAATAAVGATLPAGVTIVGTAFTACTAGGAGANTAEWIYSTAANVWYRIQ
jgi:hypothetical protein